MLDCEMEPIYQDSRGRALFSTAGGREGKLTGDDSPLLFFPPFGPEAVFWTLGLGGHILYRTASFRPAHMIFTCLNGTSTTAIELIKKKLLILWCVRFFFFYCSLRRAVLSFDTVFLGYLFVLKRNKPHSPEMRFSLFVLYLVILTE